MTMKLSANGIKLIKSYEGCRLTAYKPVSTEKYYTIGYGHYGSDVKKGQTITQAQADALFLKDIAVFEAYVNNKTNVPFVADLTQNMFDALVSFCYNCGSGALRKVCSNGMMQTPTNMSKYIHSGSTILAGLVKRRATECALFNKAKIELIGTKFKLMSERSLYKEADLSSQKVVHSELTATQRKYADKDQDGRLDTGATITALEILHVCGSIFIKTYSGYLLAYSRKTDKLYVDEI